MRITLPCWHLLNPAEQSSEMPCELVPVSDWAVPEPPTGAIPAPFRLLRMWVLGVLLILIKQSIMKNMVSDLVSMI